MSPHTFRVPPGSPCSLLFFQRVSFPLLEAAIPTSQSIFQIITQNQVPGVGVTTYPGSALHLPGLELMRPPWSALVASSVCPTLAHDIQGCDAHLSADVRFLEGGTVCSSVPGRRGESRAGDASPVLCSSRAFTYTFSFSPPKKPGTKSF